MRHFLHSCIIPYFLAAAVGASPELIDRIVAVVDDEVILWSELNFRLRFQLEQMGYSAYLEEENLVRLREEALDEMIDEQILLLKAQEDSIAIDESKVEEILSEQYNAIKNDMGSDGFKEMIKRAGLSERQLRNRYRKEIRHSLLYQEMLRELAFRLHVTHRDIEAYRQTFKDSLPERISLSRIRIKSKPDEELLKANRDKIGEIQQKIAAGADFAGLARAYSEDPGTAAQGGDLGCFAVGRLVPEFEAAAFDLRPGEVSEPVLTQYGYHLILLHEKREDELCASHILLRTSTTRLDDRRVEVALNELRQRALAGEDFSQLAREHSDERNTAMRGGFWEIVLLDQLPPPLHAQIGHLSLGEISDPFFMEDGGYIVKINDDQSTLESLIREERLTHSMREHIDEYRTEIHVEKRMDVALKEPAGNGAP